MLSRQRNNVYFCKKVLLKAKSRWPTAESTKIMTMDIEMYLEPVSEKCLNSENIVEGTIGKSMTIYTKEGDFPDLEGIQIAIIGVNEDRGSSDNIGCADAPDAIRQALYQLFDHHEEIKIADIGNIKLGQELSDTYFAAEQVMTALFKNKTLPIILGGSQDLTYTMYKVYEYTGQLINIVSIDPTFDLGDDTEEINSHSYMSHVIMHKPSYLFNYTNIGYQTYYVSKKSVDLMKQLLFDSYRLGSMKANMELTEPLIRNGNILSIDMSAFRAADAPGVTNPSPNGFNGEDACRMTRYAGMSCKLSSLGVFEYNPHCDVNGQTAGLIAQMLWYFIDGFAGRTNDFPTKDNHEMFRHFYVQVSDIEEELEFLCHKMNGKWWMSFALPGLDKPQKHYIPCSKEDYQQAMNDELPDHWWQFYQKLM